MLLHKLVCILTTALFTCHFPIVLFIIPYIIFTFTLVLFQDIVMRIPYQSYKCIIAGESILGWTQDMDA